MAGALPKDKVGRKAQSGGVGQQVVTAQKLVLSIQTGKEKETRVLMATFGKHVRHQGGGTC